MPFFIFLHSCNTNNSEAVLYWGCFCFSCSLWEGDGEIVKKRTSSERLCYSGKDSDSLRDYDHELDLFSLFLSLFLSHGVSDAWREVRKRKGKEITRRATSSDDGNDSSVYDWWCWRWRWEKREEEGNTHLKTSSKSSEWMTGWEREWTEMCSKVVDLPVKKKKNSDSKRETMLLSKKKKVKKNETKTREKRDEKEGRIDSVPTKTKGKPPSSLGSLVFVLLLSLSSLSFHSSWLLFLRKRFFLVFHSQRIPFGRRKFNEEEVTSLLVSGAWIMTIIIVIQMMIFSLPTFPSFTSLALLLNKWCNVPTTSGRDDDDGCDDCKEIRMFLTRETIRMLLTHSGGWKKNITTTHSSLSSSVSREKNKTMNEWTK